MFSQCFILWEICIFFIFMFNESQIQHQISLSPTLSLSKFLVTHSSFLAFLVGSLCNCILPEALKTSTVRHDSNFQEGDCEKKRLRTAFSCFSSISVPQREVSMSSLFLHSHYKGCLPPWELKRSRKGSLKER